MSQEKPETPPLSDNEIQRLRGLLETAPQVWRKPKEPNHPQGYDAQISGGRGSKGAPDGRIVLSHYASKTAVAFDFELRSFVRIPWEPGWDIDEDDDAPVR